MGVSLLRTAQSLLTGRTISVLRIPFSLSDVILKVLFLRYLINEQAQTNANDNL